MAHAGAGAVAEDEQMSGVDRANKQGRDLSLAGRSEQFQLGSLVGHVSK
jgi:hypothetical protein